MSPGLAEWVRLEMALVGLLGLAVCQARARFLRRAEESRSCYCDRPEGGFYPDLRQAAALWAYASGALVAGAALLAAA